jgi:hypothetical protein
MLAQLNKRGKMFNEAGAIGDRLFCAFGRDFGACPGFVIGNGFEIVSVTKKRPHLGINAGVVFRQA